MPFSWRLFLDIADELAARADEAAWRSAMSRAYYGVLGEAVEALPAAERSTIHPGNAHERTWRLYATSSVAPCRQLGNLGFRIRDRRRLANYRANPSIGIGDVRQAVADAHLLLTLLDRHGYQP